MGQLVSTAVEAYLDALTIGEDDTLRDVAAAGAAAHLPLIDRQVGGLLHVLTRALGARRVLEIGTAIGYSGIWLGRALAPGGLLVTIELDAERAVAARDNFARAGLGDSATVMIGDASRLLHKLAGPFDLIFQDGDKSLYEPLHDRLVALLRPAGLLVVDNVLWGGEVVPGLDVRPTRPPGIAGAIAAYNRRLAADPRLAAVFLPVRDGVAVAVKSAECGPLDRS